jgi:PhoPQ-activated pathogenicity-related protein
MKAVLKFTLPSAVCAAALLCPSSARADLASYLKQAEPEFRWKLTQKSDFQNCEISTIKLTSQKWQGIVWEHDLILFRPKDAQPTDKILLLNSGGKAGVKELPYGMMLSGRIKAPCAMLLGIPNQPLFDGKKEDKLIAETFVRYLDTQDSSWPLLFPMVKSLVKAMDAIQEFSRDQWQRETKGFVVTGASKRGWTTWLTAASDPRVSAIAPMVIDTLNIPEQIPHQADCFGGYSEQILPYTERGLVPLPDTAAAKLLWQMVDPFSYRDRFTMPKLIVCGNNDRYWSTDALNLYWDDLPGPKWIAYSPNAGHSLEQKKPDGSKDAHRAIDNVCAFVRHLLVGKPIPALHWKHDDTAEGKLRISVESDNPPKLAHLWKATAPTKDFRNAVWEPTTVEVKEGRAQATVAPPPAGSGCVAFFMDFDYQIEDIPFSLCTQLRIAGNGNGRGNGNGASPPPPAPAGAR